MTFIIRINDMADFAILDAVDHVLAGLHSTLDAFAAGITDSGDLAASIHAKLQTLSAQAEQGIDSDVTAQICQTLGSTIGHAVIDANRDDDAATDLFLKESIDDLVATIEAVLGHEELRASCEQATRRLLRACADCCVDGVADGEHYGDLLIAAADAVAAIHLRAT